MAQVNLSNNVTTEANDEVLGLEWGNNYLYFGARIQASEILSDESIVVTGRVNNNSQAGVARWTLNGRLAWFYRWDRHRPRSLSVDETARHVYVGNDVGEVFCLDLDTGEYIWEYDVGTQCRALDSNADYIFAGDTHSNTSNGIAKLDKTGALVTNIDAGSVINNYSITCYQGDVYYTVGNTLKRINATNNSNSGSATLDNAGYFTRVDADGVYICASGIERWDHDLTTRSWVNNIGSPSSINREGDTLLTNEGKYRISDGMRFMNRCYAGIGVLSDGSYIDGHYKHGWRRYRPDLVKQNRGRHRRIQSKGPMGPNYTTIDTNQGSWYERALRDNSRTILRRGGFIADDDGVSGGYGPQYCLLHEYDANNTLFTYISPTPTIYAHGDYGEIQWEYSLTSDSATAMKNDGSGGVYVGTVNGDVMHIDSTGTVQWTVNPGVGPVFTLERDETSLYVLGGTQIKELNTADGSESWSHDFGMFVWDVTIDDTGALYFVTDDEDLPIEKFDGGSKVDSWAFPEFEGEEPMCIDYDSDHFYFGTTENRVWKFNEYMKPCWHYNHSNGYSMVYIDANDWYVYINDTYDGIDFLRNIPAFTAHRKTKVHFTARYDGDLQVNGEWLDRMNTAETEQHTFTVDVGDSISANDHFIYTAYELE